MKPMRKVLATIFCSMLAAAAGAQSATALLGAPIEDEYGNEIGVISDLLIEDGEIVSVELVPGASLELQGALIEVPYGSLQFGDGGNIVMARSQAVLLASASAAEEAEGQREREGGSDTAGAGSAESAESADAAAGSGNADAVQGRGVGEARGAGEEGEARDGRGAGAARDARGAGPE